MVDGVAVRHVHRVPAGDVDEVAGDAELADAVGGAGLSVRLVDEVGLRLRLRRCRGMGRGDYSEDQKKHGYCCDHDPAHDYFFGTQVRGPERIQLARREGASD